MRQVNCVHRVEIVISMLICIVMCHIATSFRFSTRLKRQERRGYLIVSNADTKSKKKNDALIPEKRGDDVVAQDPPSIDNPPLNLSGSDGLKADSRRSRGRKAGAGPSGPCLACGATDTVKWRPSWDSKQGVLCNPCGKRHIKHPAHCTLCGFIPKKEEWEKMEIMVRIGEQGEKLFWCPTCSRQTVAINILLFGHRLLIKIARAYAFHVAQKIPLHGTKAGNRVTCCAIPVEFAGGTWVCTATVVMFPSSHSWIKPCLTNRVIKLSNVKNAKK